MSTRTWGMASSTLRGVSFYPIMADLEGIKRRAHQMKNNSFRKKNGGADSSMGRVPALQT